MLKLNSSMPQVDNMGLWLKDSYYILEFIISWVTSGKLLHFPNSLSRKSNDQMNLLIARTNVVAVIFFVSGFCVCGSWGWDRQ